MKIVTSDNLDPNWPDSSINSNCLVGVIFAHDHRLAICRLGDDHDYDHDHDSWSTVIAKGRPMQCFSDLMFYEGKLYVVGPDHVLLLDYNGPNNLSIKKKSQLHGSIEILKPYWEHILLCLLGIS